MRLSPQMRILAVLFLFNVAVILGIYVYLHASSAPELSSAASLTPSSQRVEALGEVTPTAVPARETPTSIPSPTPSPAPSPKPTQTSVATMPAASPTSAPSPSPTVDATVKATPAPGTPSPQDATALLQQLSHQEETLRSGRLSAVLNLGTGESSVAEVLFDLGNAEPRLRSKTTYTGVKSSRVLERVVVGSQAWQSQQAGEWTAVAEEEGVAGRVRDYLPAVEAAADVRLERIDAKTTALRWYDPTRDADVTVDVDSASGIPLFLSLASRGSKSVLTVNYVGWNVPVEIGPPGGA